MRYADAPWRQSNGNVWHFVSNWRRVQLTSRLSEVLVVDVVMCSCATRPAACGIPDGSRAGVFDDLRGIQRRPHQLAARFPPRRRHVRRRLRRPVRSSFFSPPFSCLVSSRRVSSRLVLRLIDCFHQSLFCYLSNSKGYLLFPCRMQHSSSCGGRWGSPRGVQISSRALPRGPRAPRSMGQHANRWCAAFPATCHCWAIETGEASFYWTLTFW